MNLSYNHGRSEKGHCVSPFPSVVADSEPRQSAWWAGMWQRTLLPIFIAGSGSLTAALTHFSYFWESYRLPGAQNSKKVFMVLIPQCCSWSEWLYFECSPCPGKTRCSIYDQCIFSRPSLDCLWQQALGDGVYFKYQNTWPPSLTHLLLLSGRLCLFVSALRKRPFNLKLHWRRICKQTGGFLLNIWLQ